MKFWAGVILFFGIGVSIALAVAFPRMDRGSSVVGTIGLGSCVGAYGAWFVFYVALNAFKRFRGLGQSAKRGPGS